VQVLPDGGCVVEGAWDAAGAWVVGVAQALSIMLATITRDTKINKRLVIFLLQEIDKII
jgi:hypothetical protein